MLGKFGWQKGIIYYGMLIVIALIIIFPIYYMGLISLKIPKDIYRSPSLLPINATIDNSVDLFTRLEFYKNIANSVYIATSATVISVAISSLAAYSLIRLKYPGRNFVGKMILFSYLTPAALLFIPLSVIINRMQLGNSRVGLIFVYLTFSAPLSTWLLMGFFRSIPVDLEEQARVDGATRIFALFRIVLPLAAPGLMAVAILTFTNAWNELLLGLIFITTPAKQTVPVAMSYLITGDVFRWGLIMAGAVAAAVPVMILYFLGQRFVVQGLAAGGVKG